MADVGEILRTTVRYSAPAASQMLNIFHHVVDVAEASDTDVANTINAWVLNDWGPQWADSASNQATLEDISVDVVNVDGTVARALGGFLIAQAGGSVGNVLPAANAAYILLKTIVPKVRGVKYIPGWSENAVDSGEWNASAIADLALLLIEYATSLASAGTTELIPGVPSKSLLQFEPFLDTGIVETLPAYQRRRKENVGS